MSDSRLFLIVDDQLPEDAVIFEQALHVSLAEIHN